MGNCVEKPTSIDVSETKRYKIIDEEDCDVLYICKCGTKIERCPQCVISLPVYRNIENKN